LVKRTTYVTRDGESFKIVSDIKKKKEKKEVTKEVAARMKIPKFGACASQPRGSLEPGIIVISKEEVRIMNRKTDVERDIGDKLRDAINDKKMIVLREMKDARERENKEKLAKLFNTSKTQVVKRQYTRVNAIKISGFNPTYNDKDIRELFEKVGRVRRVTIPRDWNTGLNKNFAFIEFDQTIHVKDAVNRFNDKAVDGCVLNVTELDNK
jgi:RNA recognition motif-containing protein